MIQLMKILVLQLDCMTMTTEQQLLERNNLSKVTIRLRQAKNKQERLYAALNSTTNDLYYHNGRVIVTGKNKDGEVIELGCVSETVLFQRAVNPCQLIDSVLFGV